MSDTRGVLVLGADAEIKGNVTGARRVEVYGAIDGAIEAGDVVVHQGGRVVGPLKSATAEVSGTLQGDVRVQNLITIKSTGVVTGNVKYGRLAMDEGAELSASVRNVPPSIAGDLDLTVPKGRSVRITAADLSAHDPDDKAEHLSFEVSNATNGVVTLAGAPGLPVVTFTQADLDSGSVYFAHDGSDSETARFDVVVSDRDGATSGAAKTINVAVRA